MERLSTMLQVSCIMCSLVLFYLIIIYSDENQEEYSDVSVITTNEDFTQSVKTRNLYSYQAELDAKIDQEVAINYKVEIRYNF